MTCGTPCTVGPLDGEEPLLGRTEVKKGVGRSKQKGVGWKRISSGRVAMGKDKGNYRECRLYRSLEDGGEKLKLPCLGSQTLF